MGVNINKSDEDTQNLDVAIWIVILYYIVFVIQYTKYISLLYVAKYADMDFPDSYLGMICRYNDISIFTDIIMENFWLSYLNKFANHGYNKDIFEISFTR